MSARPQLYLLELMIAAMCVGALTLLIHRGFGVLEMQSFFVAIAAVGLGMAVFWIYFAPRASTPQQRTLSFITSLIVGMGLAPWIVEPITDPIFAARSDSSSLFSTNRAIDHLDELDQKLLRDGFKRRDSGAERIYSRRGVIVSVVPHCIDWDDGKPPTAINAIDANIGWSAQGFWFQVNSVEAEANAYERELEVWEASLPATKP